MYGVKTKEEIVLPKIH